MILFSKIIEWLRKIFTRSMDEQGKGADKSLPIAVSSEMANAIDRWRQEYMGNAPWLSDGGRSLGLPAQIVSEMATLVTLEAEISISGSDRADWIASELTPVLDALHRIVEYSAALGGVVLKPSVHNNGIGVDVVFADDFYPVAFNSRNQITSAVFVERKRVGQTVFSRVEHHSVTNNGYVIKNKAYRGRSDDDPGREIPLTDVPEWRDIKPETEINGLDFPLFAYFKMPFGNFVDPRSPLGVSVFARAEGEIEDADRQYQRLLWEYRGGELAIHASEDAFEMDLNGRAILPRGKERLYVATGFASTDGAGAREGIFSTYSPALRDASYIAGLNTILQKIEDQCCLARGTLCDKTSERTQVATATEIKMQRQRTYATVTSIQKALEDAIRGLVQAVDAIATLYGIGGPGGNVEVAFEWDDSVVSDTDTQRERDRQDVRDGLMQKWEYRVKWYGETEEQARAALKDDAPDDDTIMNFINEPNPDEGAE